MDKKMEILYEVHDNLYVNLTNKCPCACTFCLRQTMDRIGRSDSLWLDHEPTFDEVREAFARFPMEKYGELVFCGFGEPTEALDVLLATARYAKEQFGIKIRLNTNGLANLINGKDVPPLLKGLVDTISISLNTPDEARYLEIVRPKFGAPSYRAMLDFAGEAAKYVPEVILSTVDTTLTKEEEARCAEICKTRGVTYRIRAWEG